MHKQLLVIFLIFMSLHSISQTSIGERTFHFNDSNRHRPLTTEIWYPTIDSVKAGDRYTTPFLRQYTVRDGSLPAGKFPLILLSHGTGGGRSDQEWLAQALVENGFIVAAVDHWGNTYENKIPKEFVHPWERPLDISFVLTALLADPSVGQMIDRNRIGVAGFSYGGSTVLMLAGALVDYPTMIQRYKTVDRKELDLPEMPGMIALLDDSVLLTRINHLPVLKDPRIRAFFAISPGMGPGFVSPTQMTAIDKPVFIIGSQSDSIAPVRTNAANYHHLIAGSAYYEFPGKTGHYIMLGEANSQLKKNWPTGFLDDPSVDRHAVHLKVDSLAVDFFKANL